MAVPNIFPQSPALQRLWLTRQRSDLIVLLGIAAPVALRILGESGALSAPNVESLAPSSRQLLLASAKHTVLFNPERQQMILAEILLTRHVDSFLQYLSHTLLEIFRQRPETLRNSQDKHTTAEILSRGTMEEFVAFVAEKKVMELSYKSFTDLLDHFRSMGLVVPGEQGAIDGMAESIHVRNLIVHNGGVINDVFRKRTGLTSLKTGERFEVTSDYANDAADRMRAFAEVFDAAAIGHFELQFQLSDYPDLSL